MWIKLNKSDGTCFGLNREIAYAYLLLQGYLTEGRDKFASCSPRMMNYNIKKLYQSLKDKNERMFNESQSTIIMVIRL